MTDDQTEFPVQTSLEREMEEQRRWELRPEMARSKLFDTLVENEFISAEIRRQRQRRALARVVGFAAAEVPYYRDLFRKLKLTPEDIRGKVDLPKLPLLGKLELRDYAKELQPARLPRGEKVWGVFTSSGTTGRPTKVVMSTESNQMFNVLSQRKCRWYRLDPNASFATVRLASQLPRTADGSFLADGATTHLPDWQYVGTYFKTGPELLYSITNPIEDQMAWLEKHRPAYLTSYSESLEHLAFAWSDPQPWQGLAAFHAISEMLTPSMRQRITRTFPVPIIQGYGLNEIGIVALKCPAGRYHVHGEHCLVELVDDDGQPVAPGETGRIVITGFRNLAMPLIRYDTDDLAQSVEGPCACGRTMPGFGEVVGRYSRIAYLPDGTLGLVGAVRDALETMPIELARNLRQFQLHQFRDDRFELRLLTAGALPEAFVERVNMAWQEATAGQNQHLDIAVVNQIERSPGGKFQDFTSDHVPAPDIAAPKDD